MFTPTNSLRRFRFSTLAGVEDVRLELRPRRDFVGPVSPEAANFVVGRFRRDLVEFYGPRHSRLIEEFVNSRSDMRSIWQFTRKYGPLKGRPQAGREFEFSRHEWWVAQRRLQSLWRQRSIFKPEEWDQPSGSLVLQKDWLTYRADDLYGFLCMDLGSCEPKRLKICGRPECRNPYFIAQHLRQQFCSDLCAQWGQRRWKKQWWAEHGQQWREKRSKQKGAKHVSRKAR